MLKNKKNISRIAVILALIAISLLIFDNTKVKQFSIEDYANQFIDERIAVNKTEDDYFKIIDREIVKLEKIASFNELLPATALDIWILEYRLKPEDITKIRFAGGMNEVGGWITEDTSMGKPVLVFSNENSGPKFLGVFWSGEADLSRLAGQETALRIFLEDRDMVIKETYSGNHIIVSFPLSTGEICQLLLSQPVVQGDLGIWCVERWMDGNGSLAHVTPNTDMMIASYYENLQNEVNKGNQPSLKDPLQVANEWINNDLGQEVSLDQMEVKYSASIQDFMIPPESRFIGYITNFEAEIPSRAFFHLDQIEWLTLNDAERLDEIGVDPANDMPNGFYVHNPKNYPMFFQVTKDTKYSIIELGDKAIHKLVTMEEFIKYIERFSDYTPPFWVTTKAGYVQEISEQYVP